MRSLKPRAAALTTACLLLVVPLGAGTAAQELPVPEGWGLHHRGPAPHVLEPAVSFLPSAPVIDGKLDAGLEALPLRPFTTVATTRADLPVPDAGYRLAYGAGFLYVEVEAAADHFTYRDRGYQNGDGFHLVIARPRADGSPSREFYVVACSAVDRPEREWARRVIWYHDVTDLFLPLSREAKLEHAVSDGRIRFELLLPWTDLPPYHPWLSEGIGFNLCFVKAAGDADASFHYVVPDGHIQQEQSPRRYARLEFAPPSLEEGARAFVSLDRGHVTSGEPVAATVAVASAQETGATKVQLELETGEGTRALRKKVEVDVASGLVRRAVELDEGRLPPGGYRLHWSAAGERGDGALTVLPPCDAGRLKRRIDAVKGRLSPGSFTTLEFLAQEATAELAALRPDETAGAERLVLGRLLDAVERGEAGEDVLAERSGLVRRAFRSRLDGSLQPYMVRIPRHLDRDRRYPLVVYLHGSGADERSLAEVSWLDRDDVIVVCPRARGTSHGYATAESLTDIDEAVAEVTDAYPVDSERIVVAGFSMGGYGAYREYYEHPGRYRGVAVFSGHPDIGNLYSGRTDQPSFLEPKYLRPFAGTPVFIFHGEGDRNCPFELTRELAAKLRAAGAEVDLVTEPGAGHQAPSAETLAAFDEWLEKVKSEE